MYYNINFGSQYDAAPCIVLCCLHVDTCPNRFRFHKKNLEIGYFFMSQTQCNTMHGTESYCEDTNLIVD